MKPSKILIGNVRGPKGDEGERGEKGDGIPSGGNDGDVLIRVVDETDPDNPIYESAFSCNISGSKIEDGSISITKLDDQLSNAVNAASSGTIDYAKSIYNRYTLPDSGSLDIDTNRFYLDGSNGSYMGTYNLNHVSAGYISDKKKRYYVGNHSSGITYSCVYPINSSVDSEYVDDEESYWIRRYSGYDVLEPFKFLRSVGIHSELFCDGDLRSTFTISAKSSEIFNFSFAEPLDCDDENAMNSYTAYVTPVHNTDVITCYAESYSSTNIMIRAVNSIDSDVYTTFHVIMFKPYCQ